MVPMQVSPLQQLPVVAQAEFWQQGPPFAPQPAAVPPAQTMPLTPGMF